MSTSAPFPPASFDVVASVATLHDLPDLADGLRAMAWRYALVWQRP